MKQEKILKIIQHDISRLGIIILDNYGLKYQYIFRDEGF